jgi:hypothetical protein
MCCAAIDALREPIAARGALCRRADDGHLDAHSSMRRVKETDDEAPRASCSSLSRDDDAKLRSQ